MRRSNFSQPWLSFFYGPLLMAYLYACNHTELADFYQIPGQYLSIEYQWGAMGGFLLMILIDTAWISRKRRRYDSRMQNYKQQLDELLKRKSMLQNKAHQYSAHADKLKMFISERLLEHIEYDEKFLHFKNIASEVRHNGVICYDKVNTSLAQAINQAGNDKDKQHIYRSALDSMAYLWDLLDLSTTDNIAMYIANKLYESEEQYYQQLLSEDKAPCSPTFSMRHAVIKTLEGFINGPDTKLKYPADTKSAYSYSDDRFSVELEPVGDMLGHENYLVLMLENLINNALYYSEQKKYQRDWSRIVIHLTKEDGQAILSVYNHGPTIDDETRGKIFQLGFSTKRIRENNGKGLGLYFVNEIVKGYEGQIDVHNVTSPKETYLLKTTLGNGDEVTHTVIVDQNDKQQPVCRNPENDEVAKKSRFKFNNEIKSVEITTSSNNSQSRFTDIKGDTALVDPVNSDRPTWRMQIKRSRAGDSVTFTPLDISGVIFEAKIPTAESRLDADYHDIEGDDLDSLDELDKGFEQVKEYVS
jgi:signal transduction histidine kinase